MPVTGPLDDPRTGRRPWRSRVPWPSLMVRALPRPLPGADGHIWDHMEFYGCQWFLKQFTRAKAGYRAFNLSVAEKPHTVHGNRKNAAAVKGLA